MASDEQGATADAGVAPGKPSSGDAPLAASLAAAGPSVIVLPGGGRSRSSRKRRYTRGLRDIQKVGRGWTKATLKANKAVAKGLDRYLKESDKSARKRRDGAIRDFGLNVAEGIGRTLRASAGIPGDLASVFNTRTSRRSTKRSIRLLGRLNRGLRFR